MAISIISTPNNFEPVYTIGMPIVISSTLQAERNFKYIFDLYVNDTFVGSRVSPFPRPNGLGIFSPHSFLKDNLTVNVGPDLTTIKSNRNGFCRYYYQLGEQYNPNISFADTDLSGTYLGLTFSSNISSEFFVNDIITISKDNIAINPWVDGTASITSITSNFSILTDKLIDPSVVFSSNEVGNITNVERINATSSEYIAWNASRQYDEKSKDFEVEYVMQEDSVAKFLSSYETSYLSNLTESKPIYIDSYQSLDLIVATYCAATYSSIFVEYDYYDVSGSSLGTEILGVGSPAFDNIRFIIPSGTKNITDIGGSGAGFISAGTLDSYRITMYVGDGTPVTEMSDTFTYKIIPDCRPYDIISLTFLNKLGGFDYWDFNLVSKYVSQITRTQIDRAQNSLTWGGGNRGRDIVYSKAVENWTINSDFLTDDDALFVRELVESSEVYLVNSDGTIDPIIITSDSWEYKSGLLNGYVQYTINFVKAYDVLINR